MNTLQEKTYDKRDRAIRSAIATLGADAKESVDFEVEKLLTTSGQKTVTRYVWAKLDKPSYQPNVKDRVYNIHNTVDGDLRIDIYGTVLVAGPTVSEVKWDPPAPWGQIQNCLNKHLRPAILAGGGDKEEKPLTKSPTSNGVQTDLVEDGIPEFLKVKNRETLSPEKKTRLDEIQKPKAAPTPAAVKYDTMLPRNIEPAGLEILRNKKEVKGGKPKACHRLKQLIIKNPSLSVEDLINKLDAEGYTTSPSTVSTVRADTRDTLKVLVAEGMITIEL